MIKWRMPSDAQSLSLYYAGGEVDVQEQPRGSNAGPRVEEYLASVGRKKGDPWCAAFTSWCILQAEKKLQQTFYVPKTAYTPHILQARDTQILRGPGPRWIAPGMLFLLYYKKLGRVGHVGFIEGCLDPDTVITIEGNSNDEGVREGFEVCRRERKISSIYALVGY